jgi:phosphate:Na+ symporter
LGTTTAGFGLLFLGIAMLQTAFTGLAEQATLPQGEGPITVVAQLLIGMLMTVLMQSSSASIAIALTAAQGGLLTAHGAAAVVIGANIGTTVTAMVAAIGATSNARRAAVAHVAFNIITGAVALALLPWLVPALGVAQEALGMPSDPATKLAMFHTIFNVLGVLLMWPLASHLTRWLLRRFKAREDDEAQPQYLDDNVLQVPSLAIDALTREVARVGHVAVRMARSSLAGADVMALVRDQRIVTHLSAAAESFIEQLTRRAMPQRAAERLAQVLRVLRYHETVAEQVQAGSPLHRVRSSDPAADTLHEGFLTAADALLGLCDPLTYDPEVATLEGAITDMEAAYENLKTGLLATGATGGARMANMEDALRRYSALRRAAQQAAKARRRWQTTNTPVDF